MRIKNLLYFIIISSAVIFLTCAHADDLSNSIVVSNAWVQAMPPPEKNSAAYMTIANNSQKEAVLVSASSDIAGATEIHQMSDMNGMMNMTMVSNVHIPPQGKVTLKPGGFHIMLINLKKPVNKGDIVPITLHFQDEGSIIVNADVRDQSGMDYGVINPQRDFTLHDQDGKIFHLKDHRGQVVLLFFGYTSCPDECPATLSKLARVYALLGQPIRQKVLTVFVTIDPQRDTAQKLKEYMQYFNINAMGLTGTKQEIDAVVDSYKATYEKVETNSSALGYMFDHTDYLYLIDAQGKTSYLFHLEDKAQDMAQVIREILKS